MNRVDLTIAIYQRKTGADLTWHTIGLGENNESITGRSPVKIQRKLVTRLRKSIAKLEPHEMERFGLARGMSLSRVKLELTTKGAAGKRRVVGLFPLIVEPRWVNEDEQIMMIYHPWRQDKWFPLRDAAELSEVAPRFFRHDWKDLADHAVDSLRTDGKDLLRVISFSAAFRNLIDGLAKEEEDKQKKRKRAPEPVLSNIGTDQTTRAIDGSLATGMPRAPYRAQLQHLLGGKRRRPVIVVGPPGVGKTTIVNRWIADQLSEDQFEVHRNLDKIHTVWRISGKRIIAGMSHLGDWEQRCLDLVVDAKKKRAIIIVEDLHLFGRLGQSRESERNFAEFFRGPVSRGELLLIGECTPEQLQRLEDDAPAFASLFVRLHVRPTSSAETLQMVVHEARQLEIQRSVAFHAFTFRSILELGGSLFPWTAFPGKALNILRKLAEGLGFAEGAKVRAPMHIEPSDVLELLSQQTGLPTNLLTLSERLRVDSVNQSFSRQIMGQPEAVDAACDLVFKIRAGLTDPSRPFAVQLFTGPTGTGKTALATCIAAYLFGDTNRLLRFDMSEYASADGVARLIGDRWTPEGQLTQRIREQPFAVVLLDEIEKAHPAVLNLLLQLFDEGRLTDAAGNTASFNHTVIIMTSNLGAKTSAPIGFGESTAGMLQDISKAVREFFPPELFNRIDRVVPFHPLTASAAEQIATKELASLLARRGLRERNIFVYTNSAVKARIVEEAFDPRHGARTVKRYLEDQVASLLAERITAGKRAALQVFRIYDSDGEFKLHVEPLLEGDPDPASFALAPVIDLPALGLKEHLPVLAEVVDRVAQPEAIEGMTARVRESGSATDLRYYLDQYVEAIDEIKSWLGRQGVQRAKVDPELIEAELFSRDVRPGDNVNKYGYTEGRLPRRFDMRTMSPRAERTSKAELLTRIAGAYRTLAAGPSLHDPTQHVAWIEVLRMGHGEQAKATEGSHHMADLFEWLVDIYAAQESVEAIAFRPRDNRVVYAQADDVVETIENEMGRNPKACHALIKLSGLGVYDAYRGEQGCHIWRSLAAEPEIVRVRVFPGDAQEQEDAGKDARDRLRRHSELVSEFELALERGDSELPDNPEQLMPTVRTLSFQPPVRSGQVFPIEVEDFLLSHAEQVNVRSLSDLMKRLWYVRWSREL